MLPGEVRIGNGEELLVSRSLPGEVAKTKDPRGRIGNGGGRGRRGRLRGGLLGAGLERLSREEKECGERKQRSESTETGQILWPLSGRQMKIRVGRMRDRPAGLAPEAP